MLYDPKWEQKTVNPVRSILTEARSLIERPEAWCGGGERFDFYRVCAGIAIDKAGATDRENHQKALGAFRGAIGSTDIIHWNDAPERTHADVLAAFDRAINN